MRTVELVPGIHSSALGFGCASILGSVDERTAKRALDCAIDYGVNHLDLARSYGYGEAENFVGKLLKGRRNQFVIASKFGIQANWKASLLKPIKPLVRVIRSKNKRNKSEGLISGTISNASNRFHDRLPCRRTVMRNSLEQSLQALKTDHLEYLFIHEPLERLIYIDELIETAQLLKEEGKIRAWGLAFMNKQKPIHESYLCHFDVLQFDNPSNKLQYDALVNQRSFSPNIIFSAMSGGDSYLKPLDKLRQIVSDFPNSVILCSMFNEEHIKANATTV